VLKIGEEVVNDSDSFITLLKDKNATTSGGDVVNILSSVWILDSKVLVSEDQINLSHIEMRWSASLCHQTSPGTKELLWGDMSTLGITSLLDSS